MYLVGARFEDVDAANAAMRELRQRVTVEAGDLGLRPLGSLRYEQPAKGLILAGRFDDEDVDGVIETLERHGGEIVFKRAEWRTPRPLSRCSEQAARYLGLTRRRT